MNRLPKVNSKSKNYYQKNLGSQNQSQDSDFFIETPASNMPYIPKAKNDNVVGMSLRKIKGTISMSNLDLHKKKPYDMVVEYTDNRNFFKIL